MSSLPVLTWPTDLLLYLEETHRGWRAYVKVKSPSGNGYLQGALALDPQAAIDEAVVMVRKGQKLNVPERPMQLSGIKLNLDLLGR